MRLSIIRQIVTDAWLGFKRCFLSSRRDSYGYISSTAKVQQPIWGNKSNIYIYDYSSINGCCKFLSNKGRFILKKNCSVGAGLTVITANHLYDKIGLYPEGPGWGNEEGEDVVVEEDVWIGANVILCPGVHIGRGCVVAAGSVCVKSREYPPYTVLGGNPAKVIRFRFSLEQQIEHEKIRFSEDERISFEELESIWISYHQPKVQRDI